MTKENKDVHEARTEEIEKHAMAFAEVDLREQKQYTVRRNIEALCLVAKTVGLNGNSLQGFGMDDPAAQEFGSLLKTKLHDMIGKIEA